MRITAFSCSILFSAAVVIGCSAKDDPPASGQIQIDFPSPQLAVMTQTLVVTAFDPAVSPPNNTCLQLVGQRVAGPGKWSGGTAVATSNAFTPCDVFNNKVTLPPLPFKPFAIAVAGTSADGKDLVVGCTEFTAGSGDLPVAISLVASNPKAAENLVLQTKCSTLGQFCSVSCPK